MKTFDANTEAARLVQWVRDYFANGEDVRRCVIGISGGKDSTITAALFVQALGADHVIGVRLPNCVQDDLDVARDVCDYLGIQSLEVDIWPAYNAVTEDIDIALPNYNLAQVKAVTTNLPCRLRTLYLYTIANLFHGRVVNTCNMSESYVGWDTKFGDQCGDINIFQDYTASEVKSIGYALNVPERFIEKAPADGMQGQTDEECWGFTYAALDAYLRGDDIADNIAAMIAERHQSAQHKIQAVYVPHPHYAPEGSRSLHDEVVITETTTIKADTINGPVTMVLGHDEASAKADMTAEVDAKG